MKTLSNESKEGIVDGLRHLVSAIEAGDDIIECVYNTSYKVHDVAEKLFENQQPPTLVSVDLHISYLVNSTDD